MDYKAVRTQQEALLEKLKQPYHKPVGEIPTSSVLTKIMVHSDREIESALGSFGAALLRFSKAIDIQHPGLLSLFAGQLVSQSEGSFSTFACEILKLAAYSHNSDVSRHVIRGLKKIIKGHHRWPQISKSIDSPTQCGRYIRFLPEREARDILRSKEKVCSVDLRVLQKKGKAFWEEQPNDFERFFRHTGQLDTEIDAAKSKYDHFNNLGLTSMASYIANSISILEQEARELTYLGFNRITYTQVAIILSKMAGFELSTSEEFKIRAKANMFGYEFVVHEYLASNWLECQIRAYTAQDMRGDTSDAVLNLIDSLEEMPELNGKSGFDTYRVVFPGFDYPGTSPYRIRMEGSIRYYSNIEDAHKDLDLTFAKNQFVPAVLIGEKDGVSYFICYWM